MLGTLANQKPKENTLKSCCTICLKKWLQALGSALWKLTSHWLSFHWFESPFMTFVKCQQCSVSPIFHFTFHSILSIIGNHKNNLYYQCPSEKRITSLPQNPEGTDYGMEGVELGAFSWLSLLRAAWSCCSCYTVAPLSFYSPPFITACRIFF